MVLQLLRHVAGSRNDHGDVYASMHIQPSEREGMAECSGSIMIRNMFFQSPRVLS